MSACESLAESEDDQTLSPPRCLAGVPLHVNIGRQSPSSSSSSSYQSHRHSRRSHQDQTRVVVRIRPLHPSEKAAGEKCCIRPLPSLEVSSTDPQRSSCTDKKKHVLSPSMSQVNHSVSRRQKSQSLLMPSSLYNDGICDKKLCKEAAKETRVTSLVSGTENTVRFDFDEVIGPGKTQKECYERAVGDVVRRNIAEGRDTTIIALGHRKSGLSYTVNGGWKVRHKAGQHKPFECNLAESAGLLPRAVHDLFQPCNSTSYDDRMTVSMAFYMIECEGGRERDLLSKFENKSKEIIEGVSYLRVDSPQEVKRLMDRVSDTRASSIREGRNFHLFSSFRAKSCRRKTSDLNKEVCSKLTVVNLMTSSNPQIGRKSCESLREILLRLSGLQALGSQSGGNIIKFSRRLDDALLGKHDFE